MSRSMTATYRLMCDSITANIGLNYRVHELFTVFMMHRPFKLNMILPAINKFTRNI